jgi:hypothetical protein
MNRQRSRAILHGLSAGGLIIGLVLGVSPVAAHAEGWRTVTVFASSTNPAVAEATARTQANNGLLTQATSALEACTNVEVSTSLRQIAGSTYVYEGTARGYCVVTPPYSVHRTAVRQYGSASQTTADSTAQQLVRADLLAVGGSCTNIVVWSRWVYVSPARDWYIYEGTADGLCSN